MKKIVKDLVLVLVAALFLTGGTAVASEKEVGVFWIGKSKMATRVGKGFAARMREAAPEIKTEYKMALDSEKTALEVYNKWQETKDAVVGLRSSGAKFIGKHPSKIPSFIGGCNNPVLLGVVDNLETHGGNIAGVSYYIHAKKRVEAFKKLMPNIKSLVLIMEEGHPTRPIDQAETREACLAHSIEYNEALCATSQDVMTKGKEFAGKVDLILLGSQHLVSAQAINLFRIVGKTPIASYVYKPENKFGAVCGLVADDEKMGRILADSVIAVIKENKNIAETPIKLDTEPKFLVNKTMTDYLGISIPDDVAKIAEIVHKE